jgi:D-3-phosphoglycerate dehydrogenase
MTSPFLVGVTDHPAPSLDIEQAVLGPKIRLVRFDAKHEDELDPARLAELDGLLAWNLNLTARTAAHLGRCRIVTRFGVGYDKIDVAAFEQVGIPVSNNPDYGTEEVADSAVALILSLQRRIPQHDDRARAYRDSWQSNVLAPLPRSRNTTIGVIGVGRIGTAVINRLKPFGHTLLGYDPYQPSGHEKAIGYQRVDQLEQLLAAADIITLHCPLTPETRGLINAASLEKLKPGAILVNTARGKLVDSLDSIEAALRSGRLASAGLDVLPDEPPRPHSLLDAWRQRAPWLDGRLVITPHVAFFADQAWIEQRSKAAETVRIGLLEGRIRNRVRPS